jgi:hypothetical protein
MGTEFGLGALELSLQPQLQTVKKTNWFLILLLFAVSCLDQPECYLLNNNFIGVAFRVMGSGSLDSAKLSQVLINGIPHENSTTQDIFDKTHDSLVSTLQLPLNYFENSSILTFNSTTSENSIIPSYERQTQFVSEECGPRYILSKLNVLETTYDSIRIVNNTPSRSADGRHIEIFRCPITDTLRMTFHQLYLPATTVTSATATAGKATGADLASILVNESTELYVDSRETTVDLPVNLEDFATTYTFNFSGDFGYEEPTRTIHVQYEKETVTRFNGCGEQTFVTGLNVQTTTMDSASVATDSNGILKNVLTDPFSTNINVYRCPPTNILQAVFVAPGTTNTKSVKLLNIAADYATDTLFYENASASTVRLPLDESKGSTTFTFNFEGSSQVVALTYSFAGLGNLYRQTCNNKQRIVSLDSATPGVEINNEEILYPAVTNIFIEVP